MYKVKDQGIHIGQAMIHIMLASSLSFFAVLMDVFQVGVASFLINIIYILLAVLGGRQAALQYIAIALPNTKCLTLFGVSDAVIICLCCVILRCLTEKILSKKIVILSVIHIFLGLTILVRYKNITYGVVFPIKMLAVILFYYYAAKDLKSETSLWLVKKKYAHWIIAYCMGILSAFAPSLFFLSEAGRLFIAGNDPNILAIEAVFVMTFTAVLYFRSRLLSHFWFYLSFISMAMVCALTGSRMGLLLLAFSVCLLFLLNLKKVGKNLILLGVLTICAVLFLTSSYGQNMLDTLNSRSNAMANRGDISNGRFTLWEQYIHVLNENPICWLLGMGDYTLMNLEAQAHNMVLEDIAAYGLIGMFFLYWMYLEIYRISKNNLRTLGKKRNRIDLFLWMPVIVVICGNIVLRTLTNVINTTMLLVGATLPHLMAQNDNSEVHRP